MNEVGERALEVRVDELEVALDEAVGDAAAARERKLGFRPQQKRSEAHEPRGQARTPPTLQGTVILANAAMAVTAHKVQFLHIPTLASTDDAWFAPLAELKADGARVYMGAIHHLHGARGMGDQLLVIKRYLSDFGLGSPCGFGRAADRSDRLITDDGSRAADPIKVILQDHRNAVAMLLEVMKH